jgi:iron-sulfur cluster repair protein YtfE (RIC family)
VAAPRLKTLAEIKSLAALMESMLRAHSDTEDELFIGPLEHCFDQIGQRDAFLEEHQEIDGNLKKVREAKQVRRARQLLIGAVAYSRRHFDKEERIVFPMAELDGTENARDGVTLRLTGIPGSVEGREGSGAPWLRH